MIMAVRQAIAVPEIMLGSLLAISAATASKPLPLGDAAAFAVAIAAFFFSLLVFFLSFFFCLFAALIDGLSEEPVVEEDFEDTRGESPFVLPAGVAGFEPLRQCKYIHPFPCLHLPDLLNS